LEADLRTVCVFSFLNGSKTLVIVFYIQKSIQGGKGGVLLGLPSQKKALKDSLKTDGKRGGGGGASLFGGLRVKPNLTRTSRLLTVKRQVSLSSPKREKNLGDKEL